jgi:cell wall assembly regulator SMI1
VEQLWDRIHRLLGAVAPELLVTLTPGASDARIAATEQELGIAFPEDYRASLRIHESRFYLIDGWSLDKLATSVARWKLFQRLTADGVLTTIESPAVRVDGAVRRQTWNQQWIPIARDGGGGDIALDLDPPPSGNLGQLIMLHHDSSPIACVAPSFRSWLEQLADDLEHDRYEVMREGGLVTEFVRRR